MHLFKGLKKPIYTDWVFYLWLLGEVAIIPTTLGGGYGGLAGIIDFLFGSIIQYLIFLRLPVFIRSKVSKN